MIGRALKLVALGLGCAAVADRLLRMEVLPDGRPITRPIRSRVVIGATTEDVWTALADIPAQPRWMRDMKAVTLTTPGPVGVGTRGEADVRIFGFGVTDPVAITVWDPPRRFAIEHLGAFAGTGRIELAASPDETSTVVTWDETLVPPVFHDLGALLLRPILRRVFQADLDRLRGLVESGAWSDGAAPGSLG